MKNNPDTEKLKESLSLFTLVSAIFTIYQQEKCPRCRCISPYYLDCPVCCGYVIGCDRALKEDILIKYISYLKSKVEC